MVHYFRQYHLDANNLYLPNSHQPTAEELIEEFDPIQNVIDK